MMNHMSSKVNRINKKTENRLAPIMNSVLEYAVALVMIVLCVVLPLYAQDGYYRIGDAKFEIYRSIMLLGMPFLLVLEILYLIGCRFLKKEMSVSVTDCLVAAYLMFMAASVLCGGFYEDMFWGSDGWYMGFFSQLSFVAIYLFMSRFGRYYELILRTLLAVGAVVFTLGILHRIQIDPLGFYDGLSNEQKAQFLSTLGQATWYASFLIVVLPVGIALFLYTKNRWNRLFAGVVTALGMATLVSQNSDSAYFALAGFMLVFFSDAVRERTTFQRYLIVLSLFFAAGKGMYFLMQKYPNPDFEADFVSRQVNATWIGWVFLAVCILLLTGSIYRAKRSLPYPAKGLSKVVKWSLYVAGAGIFLAVMVLVLDARGVLPSVLRAIPDKIPYLHWNDEWGNGRGRIWTFTAGVYRQEPFIKKLFGVGPDCYYSYLLAEYPRELVLYWGQKMLTNGHNEWFTMLINGGIFGLLSYMGIFLSMIYRAIHRKTENFLLIGIAAAGVSYMAYNFFCYQQILCTPFIFLLLGMGEYILRQRVDKTKSPS